MKFPVSIRRFLFISLFAFFAVSAFSSAQAATYYLAPSGSDTNACTITAPCFTLQKAWSLVSAGDTIYLRGGTYTYTKQQGLTGKNGTAGNLIKVWAYPGETPVITRSATGYTTDIYWHRSGIFFSGNYVHFKGLEITGYKNISGNVEDGLLAYDANNNIFEQLNIHHNFHGMYIENNSSNNLILNCDFHDNYTDYNGGGDSDGLGISYNTGANNVVQGSRAWNNGDDGFDTFEAKGLVTFKNSWAWHNGYVYGTSTPAGNGVGFKLGSNFLQGTSLQNTVVRVVQNTIAVDNRDSGYHINEGDHRTQLYNNISYANSNTGLNFHWNNLVHTFKNNVSFGNANRQVEVSSNSVSTNNSYGTGYSDGGTGWAQTASAADFVSLDITQLDNPRNADGSLPTITAFTLAPTSDLINAGTNVGLPYNGSAPDIGAFEYGGTTTPPSTTFTIGQRVQVSATSLNVRATASATGTLLGTQASGALGTVTAGPTAADGYVWWNINYDTGVDGWSAENFLTAYTAPAPDTTAPTVPTNLTGTPTASTVALSWTASTDNIGVSGYRIFRSTTSTGTYTQIGTATTTTYTDTALTASTTYYYKVSAYDAAGNSSAQTAAKSVVTSAATSGPATYYLAPTGNDANACTIASPCFTLERAWQLIQAGDTVYLRGGTYAYNDMQYLQGKNGTTSNLIKIWAYPGETPKITRSSTYKIVNGVDQDLIYLEGNYFHFKGIEISYFEQKPDETSYPAFRAGFTSGSIFENINYHHNMSGFQIRGNSTGNLILNSDFHHNKDPYGATPYDGADGLGITFNYDPNSINTIRGSRAYWNADDGFDTWENAGHVIIENSWSFYNGYLPDTFTAAGNGTAFKLGSIATPSTQTKRTLKNNIAYKNRFAGYVENNAGVKMELYNNTSVNAGYAGYWFGAWGSNGNVTIAKNNLDYLGTNAPGPFNGASTVTNNSWQNNRVVTNADFANMTDSQLLGARKSDGSLPDITFLTLAAGSDLIDAGTPVSGMTYSGSAPDIGAFEYGGTTTPPSTTFTIGQRVQVSATSLNVRATASATGTLLGTQASGALGTVTAGPTAADGYVWWNINYDTGVDGWSAESFLTAYTAPAPDTTAPSVPTNLTGTGTTNTVALSWTASTDNIGVSGYRIFRSTTSTGTYTQIGTSTTPSYTDTGLTASTTYYYKVSAYDVAGNSSAQTAAKSVVTSAAANQAPTANAGADQTITLPTNSVTLSGSGTDSDGTIASYAWTKVSGGSATITSPSSASTTVTGLVQGTYTFRLTVTDNGGSSATDDVIVVVNAQVSGGLFVAGDRVEVYGGSVRVRATPTTSGTNLGTQTAGKLGTVIGGPSVANGYTWWNVNFDTGADGWVIEPRIRKYTATAPDTTAPSVPTNLTGTPTASTVALSWTASTDNVGVTGYRIFRSATTNGTYTQIGTATTTTYTDTALTASTTYYYKVSAYDAAGNSSAQTAAKSVVTSAAANQAPTANAGADQTITLPTNSVTLSGSGTDSDGTIASYAWTKVSGGSATITSPSSASTTVTGLTEGTYSFWLTVTDNAGATNADAVVVTVNAAPIANQILTANAINDAGYAYRISQNFGIPGDTTANPFQSTLRVFENGVELTQSHADHVQIESTGLGRFSHWVDENGYEALYLSTPDNTDPRTNGRVYTYRTDGTAGTGGGGGGTTVGFTDNFNRANSTDLGSSWIERYGASNFRVQSNALQLNVNDGDVSSAHTTSGVTSANYTVSSKISFPNQSNIMYAGVSGRRSDYGSTDSNGYMAFVEIYDQFVALYKRVDGEWIRLGESAITLPVNTYGTIGLSMNGSTIKALWNGSPVVTVSDSTFTTAGSAGAITGSGFTMTGVKWDDFEITP